MDGPSEWGVADAEVPEAVVPSESGMSAWGYADAELVPVTPIRPDGPSSWGVADAILVAPTFRAWRIATESGWVEAEISI